MTAWTVWLLLSIGNMYQPTLIVERFASQAECERVMWLLNIEMSNHACIRATIYIK